MTPMMEAPPQLDIFTARPGTAAYANRDEAARFREDTFQPTAGPLSRTRVVNLVGGFFELGAVDEMLMPVARAIPSGAYGDMSVVVVTSDESLTNYVRFLSSSFQAPLWVSSSLEGFADNAEPAGALAESEQETLREMQRLGGRATAAQLAEGLSIEQNAASNRVASLERKGYVFRHSRSKREGDIFVLPIQASARPQTFPTSTVGFVIPEEIRSQVVQLAAIQGKTPLELVADAWQNYAQQNAESMRDERRKLTALLEQGDEDGFLAAAMPDLDDQAAEIVKRQSEDR